MASLRIQRVRELLKREIGEAIRREFHRIQSLIGRSVVLKYTPTLKFVFDDSIVRGNRVLQIIEEIEKNIPIDSGPTEEP